MSASFVHRITHHLKLSMLHAHCAAPEFTWLQHCFAKTFAQSRVISGSGRTSMWVTSELPSGASASGRPNSAMYVAL